MSDAINPNHYKGFSNGAETIDILENLVSNCSNTAKYAIRAGRIDGNTKHDLEGRIEDMKKSRWYADREIKRLGGDSSSDNLEFVVKNMSTDLLVMLGIVSDNAAMANKIIDRMNHPAYSDYELVLTFRKA